MPKVLEIAAKFHQTDFSFIEREKPMPNPDNFDLAFGILEAGAVLFFVGAIILLVKRISHG